MIRGGPGAFVVAVVMVVLTALPANAHFGYHYSGGDATQQYEGAEAQIEVTNPALPGNPCVSSTDFFASRIMVEQGQTAWMEVGWAKVGWRTPGLCTYLSGIYVFDTNYNEWFFFDNYQIFVGGTITVRVFSDVACGSSAPCVYRARLWWNGTWVTLHAASINLNSNGYPEEYGEVYTGTYGTHFDISNCCSGNIDWWNTKVLKSDRTWATWSSSVPTVQVADAPYTTTWVNNYYRFKVWGPT